MIFSDESQFAIGKNNRISAWRKQDESYRPDLVPSKQQEDFRYGVSMYLLGWSWDGGAC